jgi:site-specific DNA recombinase
MKYFVYCRKSQEDDERQALSISTQLTNIERRFGDDAEIEVVSIYEEARTAKTPGRPRFADMLERIERGEAEGIVAYLPDRLARNSVDSGQLIYMLDTGALKDLKFVDFAFENSANGKFMLQIMFAQSKQYSDVLSDRVTDGMREKIKKLGIRPNQAPEGYLNERGEHRVKIIVPDPVRFPLLRGVIDLILAGASPAEATRIANEEWGYLTRKTSRRGGRPLALSTVYKMLRNPFYSGLIRWKGELFPGAHVPLMTLDEFEVLKHRVGRAEPARPKHHSFAFTGLMRCGACGRMITAETRIKPSGRSYTYYHCTKRGLGPRCPEPAVERSKLEAQIATFLKTLTIHPTIERWCMEELAQDHEEIRALEVAQTQSRRKKLEEIQSQLNELKSLRLRRLVTDEEFLRDREQLERDRIRMAQLLESKAGGQGRFELVAEAILLRNQAVSWFLGGSDADKRLILRTVGSNPTLSSGILSIEAARPFVRVPEKAEILSMCTSVEEVRTRGGCRDEFKPLVWKFIEETRAGLEDPSSEGPIDGLKALRERLDQERGRQAA